MAGELQIHIEANTVRFQLGEAVETLSTLVYVAAGPGQPILVSFGEAPVSGPAGVRVDLFGTDPVIEGGPDKFACLTAFLNHGMSSLMNRRFIAPKPLVVVHGSRSLELQMGGYQHGLLMAALKDAGARTVEFAAD